MIPLGMIIWETDMALRVFDGCSLSTFQPIIFWRATYSMHYSNIVPNVPFHIMFFSTAKASVFWLRQGGLEM